jgi:hypothetical protein
MAVWFIALLLIDSALLTAAAKIATPPWIAPMLAIAAIVFVPLFLSGVFLMQTVFRKELQDDQYYAEWLKRQGKTFKDFAPENVNSISEPSTKTSSITTSAKNNLLVTDDLEVKRKRIYQENKCIFLVHSWRPSLTTHQVADIVIWLHEHFPGPLSKGEVEKVEYQLGPKFFKHPKVKSNAHESFRLEISAYGPVLCLARVYFKGEEAPITLERYINFEEAPNKSLRPTAEGRD